MREAAQRAHNLLTAVLAILYDLRGEGWHDESRGDDQQHGQD
jgi:hypothetical protein